MSARVSLGAGLVTALSALMWPRAADATADACVARVEILPVTGAARGSVAALPR